MLSYISYDRSRAAFFLDTDKEPLLRINAGDQLVVETMNAFSKETNSEAELNEVIQFGYHHPFTGPIWVNNVKKGMTIGIKIENIDLSEYAYSCISRSSGVLKGSFLERNYKKIPIKNGYVQYNNMEIKAEPCVGGIGLADPLGTRNGATCKHGGNLDFRHVVPGSTVYLPAAVDGGLLYFGDLHAMQGDGELSGIAMEVSGKIKISVSLHEDEIPCPIIKSADALLIVGYGETFEEATEVAVKNATDLLANACGFKVADSYILLGSTSNLVIGHLTGRIKSVAVQIPEAILALDKIIKHN